MQTDLCSCSEQMPSQNTAFADVWKGAKDMTLSSVLLDLIAVIVFASLVVGGYKKGFLKTIVLAAGTLASFDRFLAKRLACRSDFFQYNP